MSKLTKEEIEAELNASERDKAIANFQELLRDYEEFEATLRKAEAKIWQPHWSYNDPLLERLRRIGIDQEAIGQFKTWLDGMSALHAGKPLPPEFERQLKKQMADDETSTRLVAEMFAKARKAE